MYVMSTSKSYFYWDVREYLVQNQFLWFYHFSHLILNVWTFKDMDLGQFTVKYSYQMCMVTKVCII